MMAKMMMIFLFLSLIIPISREQFLKTRDEAIECLYGNEGRQEMVERCFMRTHGTNCSRLIENMDCYIRELRVFCDEPEYQIANDTFLEKLNQQFLGPAMSRCRDALVANSLKYRCSWCTAKKPIFRFVGDTQRMREPYYADSREPIDCQTMYISCKSAGKNWMSQLTITGNFSGSHTSTYNGTFWRAAVGSVKCGPDSKGWLQVHSKTPADYAFCESRYISRSKLRDDCNHCQTTAPNLTIVGDPMTVFPGHDEHDCQRLILLCVPPDLQWFSEITINEKIIRNVSRPGEAVEIRLICQKNKQLGWTGLQGEIWINANITTVRCESQAYALDVLDYGCGVCNETNSTINVQNATNVTYGHTIKGCKTMTTVCKPSLALWISQIVIDGVEKNATEAGVPVQFTAFCRNDSKGWTGDNRTTIKQIKCDPEAIATTTLPYGCGVCNVGNNELKLGGDWMNLTKTHTNKGCKVVTLQCSTTNPWLAQIRMDGNLTSLSPEAGKSAVVEIHCGPNSKWHYNNTITTSATCKQRFRATDYLPSGCGVCQLNDSTIQLLGGKMDVHYVRTDLGCKMVDLECRPASIQWKSGLVLDDGSPIESPRFGDPAKVQLACSNQSNAWFYGAQMISKIECNERFVSRLNHTTDCKKCVRANLTLKGLTSAKEVSTSVGCNALELICKPLSQEWKSQLTLNTNMTMMSSKRWNPIKTTLTCEEDGRYWYKDKFPVNSAICETNRFHYPKNTGCGLCYKQKFKIKPDEVKWNHSTSTGCRMMTFICKPDKSSQRALAKITYKDPDEQESYSLGFGETVELETTCDNSGNEWLYKQRAIFDYSCNKAWVQAPRVDECRGCGRAPLRFDGFGNYPSTSVGYGFDKADFDSTGCKNLSIECRAVRQSWNAIYFGYNGTIDPTPIVSPKIKTIAKASLSCSPNGKGLWTDSHGKSVDIIQCKQYLKAKLESLADASSKKNETIGKD